MYRTTVSLGTLESRQEEKRKQLEHYRKSLAVILRGYARTLMGSDRLTVEFCENLPAPARLVDGSRVEINADNFTGLEDLANVASTYGTVLHELGHFEYSPPMHDPLTQWAIEHRVFPAMNLLEDMRLETRLARRWPTVAAWFDVVVSKYVLDEGVTDGSWLFLAGRETLSRPLRVEAARLYSGDAKHAAALATEYTRLVPSRDKERAQEIITEYSALLKEHKTNDPFHGEESTHNTPLTEDTQAEEGLGEGDTDFESGQSDDSQDQSPTDFEDGGESGSPSEDGDEAADEGQDEPGKGSSQPGDKEGQADDSSQDSEQSGESAPDEREEASPEQSRSAGTASNEKAKELAQDALDKALDEVRERVESDLKRLQDADLERDVISRFNGESLPVPVEFQALSASFERELKVLRGLAAPGFEERKRSGRINTRRYVANRDNPRRVFDRFNPGSREAVSLHVDILIDQSGSMGAQGKRAGFMAWAIKRALDSLGTATSSVIAFGSTSSVVYGPEQRVPAATAVNSFTAGGTNVAPAMAQALRHCHRAKARYKAVFVLTDGAWRANPEEEITRLHEKGVYTSLFYLGDERYGRETDTRGLQSLVNVSDSAALVGHIRNVVVEDIRKNIQIR